MDNWGGDLKITRYNFFFLKNTILSEIIWGLSSDGKKPHIQFIYFILV